MEDMNKQQKNYEGHKVMVRLHMWQIWIKELIAISTIDFVPY